MHVHIYLLCCIIATAGTAHAEQLTLRGCIERGLRNQPAIAAAREQVQASTGRAAQTASPYYPQVKASTGYSESHAQGGAFGDTVSKTYATTLSLNQLLYDFGRTGSLLDAARSSTVSAEWEERRVLQEVVLNVKQAYFALLQAKRQLGTAQETLDQNEKHLRRAEAFLKAGTRPKFEVTRAEVDVNSARLGLINAKNEVRIRTIMLYNAMGETPGKETETEDMLTAQSTYPPLEQAVADAMKQRPEMQKAAADIAAAQAKLGSERSAYYPSLTANGAYTWANGRSEMGPFRGDVQDSWNAGVLLTMPLYEGGITQGRVSESRAQLRAAEAQARIVGQSILIEVHQAYAELESAQVRISVMESSRKKAQESLALAQGRYDAGVSQSLEVTDAQVAALKAENDHTQALYDYQLAGARLLRAMGRTE